MTTPPLTHTEMGLCSIIHQLTRFQIEGAPDGGDYPPTSGQIIAWIEEGLPRKFSRHEKAEIIITLEALYDADILEKDVVDGKLQFHLTDAGQAQFERELRERHGRPTQGDDPER